MHRHRCLFPPYVGLSVTFSSAFFCFLSSPRMRGLSEQFEVSAPGRFVFPPHAGVIGRLYWQNVDGSRIPPLAGVIGTVGFHLLG